MPQTSVTTINEMKARGEKIAVLTCYDASFAKVLEGAGVDVMLIGDSLGMVIQGHSSTIPVSLEEMVYHCAAVSRVSEKSMLVADMPFLSDSSPEAALESASQLMKEGGAHMVKLEGAGRRVEIVRRLSENAIPVCGHLGLLPQSVFRLGGYRVQGREDAEASKMLEDAAELQKAGAQMLVLECVPRILAAEITAMLDIPVIGIGAGPETDGQVLVIYDMLGITPGKPPRFVKDFMNVADSIPEAVAAYVKEVKAGVFPQAEHCFL